LSNRDRLVEVYRAKNEMEALVIRGWLESQGIPCLLKSSAPPAVFAFTVSGLGEARVMVPAGAAARARELIRAGAAQDTRPEQFGEEQPC